MLDVPVPAHKSALPTMLRHGCPKAAVAGGRRGRLGRHPMGSRRGRHHSNDHLAHHDTIIGLGPDPTVIVGTHVHTSENAGPRTPSQTVSKNHKAFRAWEIKSSINIELVSFHIPNYHALFFFSQISSHLPNLNVFPLSSCLL